MVSLEDDGLFLLVGKYLGIGHPSGYPIHTLLANVFLKIPWGSEAFLGHLLSGVLGGFACGAVYACARLYRAGPLAALAGAWLFGASEHFWAQAIITEVYTLNATVLLRHPGAAAAPAPQPGQRPRQRPSLAGAGIHLRAKPRQPLAADGARRPRPCAGTAADVAASPAPLVAAGRGVSARSGRPLSVDGRTLSAGADLQLPRPARHFGTVSRLTSHAADTAKSTRPSQRDGPTASSSSNGSPPTWCG